MVSLKKFVVGILLVSIIDVVLPKNIPLYITKCKYSSDPDTLGKCVQKVATEITPYLAKGIPELYLPPMDPFHIESLTYDTGEKYTGVVLKALFTNMNIEGTAHVVIQKVRLDLSKPELYMETYYPTWKVIADYHMKGNVVAIPMSGHGKANLNFTEVYAKDTHIGEKYIKNGKEYIRWTECISDPTIAGGKYFFENIVEGSPTLTKSTNELLNDNFNAIYPTIKPLISETMSSLRLHLLNSVFRAFSLDELFVK